MNWYYAEDNEQIGPVDDAEFQALVKSGRIDSHTLVWNSDMSDWAPYGDLEQQVKEEEPVNDMMIKPKDDPEEEGFAEREGVCSECHRAFPKDDLMEHGSVLVCAGCKPLFIQKIKEGARLTGEVEYAGFWIRFGAKFIDGIILTVVNTIFSFLGGLAISTAGSTAMDDPYFFIGIQLILILIQIIVYATYNTWFLGKYAATPGKMACKLKVVTDDMGKITYKRALGRYFSEWLSTMIIFIGYIMAGFDEEKRALHDRICSTRVIKA